jgi:hypothetical protein
MLSAITGRKPVVHKHASALDFDPEETMLRDAFDAKDEPYPYANPASDATELRDKLAGAAEHLTSDLFALENQFRECLDEVYQQVKQAALNGVELGQVLAAWQEVIPDAAYVKTAFAHIGPRLVEEGVFPTVDAVGGSLEKTAHQGFVNINHPLVGSMAAYCTTLDKLAETHAAQEELLAHRDELDNFLQKMAVLEKVKAVGVIPTAVKALREATTAGGKIGKGTGEVLFGTGSKGAVLSELAGKAVPGAVVGTAGLAGVQDVRQRARRSPTIQRLKATLMPQYY